MSRILHVPCTSAIGAFLWDDVHGPEALDGTTGIPVISVFLSQVNDSEDSKGLLSGSKRIKRTADHREQGSPYYEFNPFTAKCSQRQISTRFPNFIL